MIRTRQVGDASSTWSMIAEPINPQPPVTSTVLLFKSIFISMRTNLFQAQPRHSLIASAMYKICSSVKLGNIGSDKQRLVTSSATGKSPRR